MTRTQFTIFSLLLATAGAGCGAAPPEADVALVQSAVTGNIVISGRVTTSSGTGLSNVTVTLAGSASTSQQTTAPARTASAGSPRDRIRCARRGPTAASPPTSST